VRIQIEDPSRGRSVLVFKGPKVVIGRHEDCDLILADTMISKVHAEIVEEDGKFSVRDKGSSNGTFLNGAMVADARLASGDRIRIGKTEIVFLSGETEERPGGAGAAAASPRKAPARPPAAGPGGATPPPPPQPQPPAKPVPAGRTVALEPPARAGAGAGEPAPRQPRRPILVAGIAGAVVLAAIGAFFIFRGGTEEGPADGGRKDVGVEEAAALLARPAEIPGAVAGGAPASTALPAGAPGLAALFAERAEYILLARCGRCHDGSGGGRFLLHDDPDGSLRSALNLAGLRPFLDPRSPGESLLLRKATGKVPHEGGAPATADEAARLASFLAEAAGKLERGASFLFPPKPPFPAPPDGVAPEKEILVRRVFLDLLGRSPAKAEIEAAAARDPKEMLDGILGGEEYRGLWNEDAAGPLRDAWGERDLPPLTRSEVVARLSALYAARLDGRLPRRKTPARIVRSLSVDLRDRVPDPEEEAALEAALEAADGELLPLAAFLLGDVDPPADREAWIDRLHVRFLLRLPEPAERAAAAAILEGKGGARVLVLGLASSPGYRTD